MAKRLAIPSKELQLFIIGPRDSFKASRIQRASLNAEIPSEDKDELGNSQHVGTVKDTPNITVSFSAFDVGIKVIAALSGVDPDAFPASGVDVSQLSEVDVAFFVKDATVSDYVKSIHGHRLQVRDFTYNYSVDGDSTEDYTAIGSERRYLKYDVIMDKFTSGTTTFTLSETPIQLKNGNYALSVTLDGGYLTEVSGAPATGEYQVVGTTLTTFDSRTSQVLAIYHADPAGNNWADVNDPAMPASVRGKDVDITIAANGIDRVQSITINGNLNVQAVKELGNRAIVGYQKQVPTVEGTITVLDTDNELISLLTDGEILASGVSEWQPGEGCTVSGVELLIKLLDPCDDTVPYTVLKTLRVPELVITGDQYQSTVNQNTQVVFNWRSNTAQLLIYSGEYVP